VTRAAAVLGALLLCSQAPAAAEDFTLRATRQGGTPLVLRAEPTGTAWRIRILDAAGREAQRIEVESDALQSRPRLSDADGDGTQDLWVPVMTGNANTEYAIWRMDPASGRFRQAGAVGGIGFRRDGGYLVAIGRNGCCGMGYEFYRFAPDGGLVPSFSLDVRYDEKGKVEACDVTAGHERPAEALRRRWCALGPDDQQLGERL